jgi:hypothetical protein
MSIMVQVFSRGSGYNTNPITAEPTRMNEVPSKALRIRKTKNAARLGDSAVPMEHPKKSIAVTMVT